MRITLNGESHELSPGTSVCALLDTLGFAPDATVVERNADIIDRNAFGDTLLSDGDTVEVVRFVGGG